MQTKINDKLAIQNFRRTLSGVTLQKWKEILCVIRNLTLTHKYTTLVRSHGDGKIINKFQLDLYTSF